jgi:hypothetical protein
LTGSSVPSSAATSKDVVYLELLGRRELDALVNRVYGKPRRRRPFARVNVALDHGTKLETARSNVPACCSQSALGAAATTTALDRGPATRHAISR